MDSLQYRLHPNGGTTMKQIVESIKGKQKQKANKANASAVVCNYQNNYYGDQVCVICK